MPEELAKGCLESLLRALGALIVEWLRPRRRNKARHRRQRKEA